MPSVSSPPFIIAGPTAVGKSGLAVAVAERCKGEVVSADAFQIYQGLEILTAQPSTALRARVPHHLIAEMPLAASFDVAQYLRLAEDRIAEIRARGRIPIIVGGTGLYLRALTHGLADLPPADPALRAELETRSTGELLQQLSGLDPVGHTQIDRQNRRRLIRALEVCLLTGLPFSSFRQQWKALVDGASGVVLNRERDELYARIERRTEAMFAAGVIEEVRRCGESAGPTARQTLGWTQITALHAGVMSPPDCLRAIQQATRRYAKRQLTWLRREPHLEWIEIQGDDVSPGLVEDLARRAITLEERRRDASQAGCD